MPSPSSSKPETIAAQALHYQDSATGALCPPVQPSTTFARGADYEPVRPGTVYGRDQNPTFEHAERVIAELEGGAEALLFSSGMAGIAALFHTLAPGDHVLAPSRMYFGTRVWLAEHCARWGIRVDWFDPADLGSLASALRPGATRIVWVETPSNPLWDITDIAGAAALAHAAGALLAVDSTTASPVLTRPLALGADIVFHAATKYLNGHSDVIAGVLVSARSEGDAAGTAAHRKDRWQAVRWQRQMGGAVPSAFDAWLLLRGMRTVFLRVRQASRSAQAIAEHFAGHPQVEQVLYPGLPSHPGHEIARRQMSGGFGGMLSLCVRGGYERARAVAGRCQVIVRATSLGGVESLIEHRASIEGPDSPVPHNLLRLSVGIEDVEDLIADLEQALAL